MKKLCKFGAVAATACGIAIFAGCSTEKIAADYAMPARQIDDVKAINVIAIDVKADVKGSAANGVSGQTAGAVKQLVSTRLYKEGYIATADKIWGDVDGAKRVQDFVESKKSQHGYASFATEQGVEKATLKLNLALVVDNKKVTKEREYVLTTVPYKQEPPKKPDAAPTSKPGEPVIEKVKKQYQVYETQVTGVLKASLVDRGGKQLYSAEYAVSMPEDAAFSSGEVSALKAISVAVGPAIDEVIADISPYKETREFEANQDGDKKVVLLLEAKAFKAAIEAVDTLKEKTFADYENQGLAYEASGDFNSAKASYAEALKLNAEAQGAKDGVKRIDEIKAAAKAVKKSGAKQDSTTTFKK